MKKSKLQKKIDDHNSTYWRRKADAEWKSLVSILGGGKCVICGSTSYVQAHHIIAREMYSHRHIVLNGIMVCASHHKYSFELSPHKAPIAFCKWLICNMPDRWQWLLAQEPSRKNKASTLKEAYELLAKQHSEIKSNM